MKIAKICVSGFLLAMLLALVIFPAGCSAESNTDVGVDAYELTISVDPNIASWGYEVKVGSDTPATPAGQTYQVVFAGKDTTVQILVGGTGGLSAGWHLNAEAINCTATIPENPENPENKNLVKVTAFTQTAASVTLSAYYTGTYTVTFDADGGSPTPQSQQVASGGKVSEPAAPVKYGYTLDGWFKGDKKWVFNTDTVTSDMTLKAHWTETGKATVTFDSDGGSYVSPQVVYIGEKVGKPADPTKTGYLFTGWYKDSTLWNFNNPVTESMTLKAHWTANTYTVKFNGNGSTSGTMSDQSFTYDVEQKLTKNTFTRTGYTFSGWAKTATGSVDYNDEESVKNLAASGTVNLYAVWTANTYTVKFNGNGATTGSMSDQSFTYDVEQNLTKNTFTRTGYTFSGWSTSASGSVDYNDEESVKNLAASGTVNLYAVWTANTYTVKFNGNGSTSGTMSDQTFTYDVEQKLTKNTFTRTGYTFSGWAKTATGSVDYNDEESVKNLAASGTVNLYAVWTANTYTVKFNGNGATTGSMSDQSFTYDVEQKLTKNAYEKTGYTFSGWSTSASGSVDYNDEESVKNLATSGTVNLYAVWTKNTYTVTFDAKGGSPTPQSQSVKYGEKATKPAEDPTKTGYTFAGWFNGDDAWNFAADIVTSNLTLTAHWTPVTYKVAFDGNGSTSGTMSDQSFTYDVEQKLTKNAYEKTGHTFAGWSTSASGSVDYTDEESVKNLSSTAGATVTLYAKWTPIPYTVTFDADGGSPTPQSQTVNYGNKATKPAEDPAKTGYTFAGWFNGDTAWNFTTDIVTSNLTLTAHWTANTYKVHFNAGSGSGEQMADQEFQYGELKQLTYNTYTKTGYTFKHWKDTNGTTYENGQWVRNLTATDKDVVTLTAEWKPVTYAVTFDANGGSGEQMADQSFTYDVEQKLTKNTFTRTGYTFAGWSTSASGSVVYTDEESVKNLTDVDKAKVPLFAVWTANTYTVHFNANGGSGEQMADQQFTYDKAQILTKNTYLAPEGKQFAGWAETASGSVVYTDEQSVKNLATSGTVNLYAVWSEKPKEYWKVSFDANGGSGSMAEISVEKGSSITVPENEFTAPEGKEFREWLVQGTATVLHPGDEFTPAADTVLVAQWKSLEYWTLTFDANGGSGTMDSVSVVKGSSVYLPSNGFGAPSHYRFNGWLIEGTKYAVGAKYTPVADVTVYATWKYTGGGGGGGGGSTPVQPVTPTVVDEITVEAEEQLIIVIPLIDEDGNIINLPVRELIMTDPVTGIVTVKDITEEINGITIIPSLKETLLNIAGFRVDTINEARALGIPVVDNYIGGNGHAPVLIESSSVVYDPVKFYQVFEITMNVTGGTLKEILFSVPLAALEEQGYTTKDVVLYHGVTENDQRTWYPLVTTHEWSDENYAYYTAITDGASPFGIMFLKDTTKTFPAKESEEEPVTPVATPVGVAGILAGLGAGALLMRRLRR